MKQMLSTLVDQSTDTRGRILQAAASAFAADGFRVSTIRSIAHAAGVNEVTVYRYFPRKEQMFWEVIDCRLRNAGISEFLLETPHSSLSPTELFTQLGTKLIGAVTQDPGLIRMLNFAFLELRRERSLILKMHLLPAVETLKKRIQDHIHGGVDRPLNIEFAVIAFLAVLFAHSSLSVTCGLDPDKVRHPEQLAAEYATLCLTGLKLGPED